MTDGAQRRAGVRSGVPAPLKFRLQALREASATPPGGYQRFCGRRGKNV
ncbi:MAG: hypothetical protein ACXQTZ_02845 [Candidatus Alkanophagales archaeon]